MKKLFFAVPLILLFALNLHGQVAFRSFANLTAGTRTDSTLNKPAGTVDNDILLAAIGHGGAVSITAPAGWTEYSGSPFDVGFTRVATYWKRASSEGASWTWTHSSSLTWALVAAYSGAKTSGDPNDVTPTINNGTGTSVTALSVTIATNNSLGVILWTNSGDTGGQTPPSGFTEHGDPNSTFGAEDKTLGTGATGNQTTTIVNSDSWAAFFTALAPPAAGSLSRSLIGVGK